MRKTDRTKHLQTLAYGRDKHNQNNKMVSGIGLFQE